MKKGYPVGKLYESVMTEVLLESRQAFQDEGVSEDLLKDLKDLWQAKLKVANPDRPFPSSRKGRRSSKKMEKKSRQKDSSSTSTNPPLGPFPNEECVQVRVDFPILPASEVEPEVARESVLVTVPSSTIGNNKFVELLTLPEIAAINNLPLDEAEKQLQNLINVTFGAIKKEDNADAHEVESEDSLSSSDSSEIEKVPRKNTGATAKGKKSKSSKGKKKSQIRKRKTKVMVINSDDDEEEEKEERSDKSNEEEEVEVINSSSSDEVNKSPKTKGKRSKGSLSKRKKNSHTNRKRNAEVFIVDSDDVEEVGHESSEVEVVSSSSSDDVQLYKSPKTQGKRSKGNLSKSKKNPTPNRKRKAKVFVVDSDDVEEVGGGSSKEEEEFVSSDDDAQQAFKSGKTETSTPSSSRPMTRSQKRKMLSLDGGNMDSDSDDFDKSDGSDQFDDDDDDESNDGLKIDVASSPEVAAEDGDEEPINSGDDPTDEDISTIDDQTDNLIICQYEKVKRAKGKSNWKFHLKSGVMILNGKEIVFNTAQGEADW